MEEHILDFLLYLDELLIAGLSSLIVEGSIEVLTRRRIFDRTLSGRLHNANKETNFCEDRYSKDKREGYKAYTNSDASTYTYGCDNDNTIEERGVVRIEEEEKRIFTMFTFHRNIVVTLQDKGELKNTLDVCSGNVNEGDYVQVSGTICSESLSEYIDSLKTIINCFGCDKLNELASDNDCLDFNIIDKFLSEIQSRLHLNNTSDLILKCENRDIVLTINNSYFLNNNANKLDNIDCNCNIVGKVVKKCCDNDHVHFLRKTGQQDFYEEMLYKCIPAFDCLYKLGITPPKCPRIKITDSPYQIIPISIFV